MKYIKLLLNVLLVFNIYSGFSQQLNLQFNNITATDGLPDNSINDIIQDSYGFMWFATRNGLVKFDGINYTTFRHDPSDSTTIPYENIQKLCLHKNEIFALSSLPLNAFAINLKNNKIRSLYSNEENTDEDIYECINNGINTLLITEYNVYIYDEEQKQFVVFDEIYELLLKIYNNIQNNSIDSEYTGPNLLFGGTLNRNNILLVYFENSGIYKISLSDFSYQLIVKNNQINSSKNEPNKAILFQGLSDKIWIGFQSGNLGYYNIKTREYKVIASDIFVNTIFEKNNNTWFATNNGLFKYNSKEEKLYRFTSKNDDAQSLASNSVLSIYINDHDILFAGHHLKGLDYARYYNIKNFKHLSKENTNGKLLSNRITGICEGKNNILWIGTNLGLVSFNIKNQKYSSFLEGEFINIIYSDSYNNIWCRNSKEEVYLKTENSKDFKLMDLRYLCDNANIFFEDKNRNFWLITDVFYKFNRLEGRFSKNFNPHLKFKDEIDLVKEDLYENFWIANEEVIKVVHPQDGVLHIIGKDRRVKHSLFSEDIRDFLFDTHDNIWIATKEGLNRTNFDDIGKRNFKFHNYTTDDGLLSKEINHIFKHGNCIWLATDLGISKLRFDNKSSNAKFDGDPIISNYTIYDGLASNVMGYSSFGLIHHFYCAKKLNSGEIVLGSNNGITIFHPDSIKGNQHLPPLVFTNLKIYNQLVSELEHKQDRKIIKKPIYASEDIELMYYDRAFSIEFIALDFAESKSNKYAYQLEGFNDDWIYLGSSRDITFTNLPGGEYNLKVKACNNDGIWNDKSTSIKIIITPPFWETIWFRILIMLILIILIIAYLKYRLYAFNKRNLELEKLVQERTADVKKANLAKLQFFTNISHELRTPLTLIKSPLENVLEKKYTDSWLKRQHIVMYENVNRLLKLINQLLDFRKIDTEHQKLQVSKGDIILFIKELFMSFSELAKQKDIRYSFNCRIKSFELHFDGDKIEKIFANLLFNAFKFTPKGGEIDVKCEITNDRQSKSQPPQLQISISDTGIGIPEDKVNHIFGRYYSFESSNIGEVKGFGIGLALCKKLVEVHKGKIYVESKVATTNDKNSGTTFKIILPTGKEYYKKEEIVDDTSTMSKKAEKHQLTKENIEFEITERQYNNIDVYDKEIPENTNESKSAILIVEDNPDVVRFLKDILQNDYRVYASENGKKGLDILNKYNFDLVLSDIMMPEMDGLELCKLIKTNIISSHIPIILLTAKSSIDSQITGLETGADDYITKPFDKQILLTKIKNHIESRKKLRAKFDKQIVFEPQKLTLNSFDEKLLKKACKLIEDNISKPDFDIHSFSKQMAMSERTLYRKIKTLTNQTPNSFITSIRIKKAAQLIIKNEQNITNIAISVGYEDISYFGKIFKKHFGVAPSNFINSSNRTDT